MIGQGEMENKSMPVLAGKPGITGRPSQKGGAHGGHLNLTVPSGGSECWSMGEILLKGCDRTDPVMDK